jgi:2-desacetyl-2-hydroxyethyl bacteriochlorophyllide A dehydrogenase
MGTALVLTQPGVVSFESQTDLPLGATEVRVRTLYSGISTGTELAAYRGSSPHLHKRWDAAKRLFHDLPGEALQYPVDNWGYEEVGEVVERGVEVSSVDTGDIVYGTWGHRTHAVLDEGYVAARRLPEGLDPVLGIYSHIGPIALNGIHDAQVNIGEHVAVFGLGVLGQVVAQLAVGSGATVIGVDLHKKRLDLARELGSVQTVVDPGDGPAGEQIKALTGGRGVDVAIEVTGAAPALHEAIRSVAYSGRVIAMGFFQGEARGLFLGEEFHHNRITVVGSQISGVAPERSYRWDRLRLVKTTMRLQAEGVLNLKPLITHYFRFRDAAQAFRLLDEEPGEALQVVLDLTEAD